jgi:hypothetical protein
MVEAADAPPAGPLIWQITEPLPQLSEEPFKSAVPRESAEALRELVAAEEAAVGNALRAGQVAAASGLAPISQLAVVEAAGKLAGLRQVLQGVLGLSTGGRAKRGQEVSQGAVSCPEMESLLGLVI